MLKNWVSAALMSFSLVCLSSPNANVFAQEKKDNSKSTVTMPIFTNDLHRYDIEVRSSQPFTVRLVSPKTVTTAIQRKNAISGAMVTPGSPTIYVAKLEISLVLDGTLKGEWTLETTFDREKFPNDYTVSIKTGFTK